METAGWGGCLKQGGFQQHTQATRGLCFVSLLSSFLSLFPFSLLLSLCLLPPCHAPLSNLFSLCVFCLFSGIFLSFLSSSSSFSRRALSSLPLQSCEKVGTVTSVCGSFESLLSICFSSIKLPFVFVCLGCFMSGAEDLNLPVQLLL